MMYDFFPVPVYSTDLKLDLKALTDFCLKREQDDAGVSISNRGGWQSSEIYLPVEPLSGLVKKILRSAESYRKIIKYKHPLKIANLWININRHKDYNVKHRHPNCVVSGVYYVNMPSGSLILYHPAENVLEYDWGPDVVSEYVGYNSSLYSLNPTNNTLVLFPSWLSHSVGPNTSTENRITISFNLVR